MGTLRALLGSLLCLACSSVWASGALVIGVENQEYLPLYTYEKGSYKGFARELFDAFAHDRGYTVEYRALPVPRLYAAFLDGQLDFKFPDNPNWKREQRSGKNIVYSDPVVSVIDGVSVTPEKKALGVDDVRVIGTMAGFTPWAWIDRVKAGKVNVSENGSFEALVRQTLAGRIDGAYASIAVVNYQLDHVFNKPGALVFNQALPYSRDSYQLSTVRHPEIVREFNAWMKQNRAMIETLKKRHGVEKGVTPE